MCATDEHEHYTQGEITAASASDSGESDYWSEAESDTTSLKSSIYEFQYENGRRYHRLGEREHLLPNDEREQDRLDLFHHLAYLLCDKAYTLAPLENPQRILDLGTGTGIWALDIATEFPSAEVIGTDVTPIQPTWTVPNCRFELDDFNESWTFPHNHFDLIHARTVAQGVKSWPKFLSQMYHCCAPGGYIEIFEGDFTYYCDDDSVPEGSPLSEYARLYHEGMEILGLKQYYGKDYIRMVREAGFTDIKWYEKKQPWSPWPANKDLKYLGHVALAVAEEGVLSYLLALLTRVHKWSSADATALCDSVLRQIKNKRVHEYTKMNIIVARKPQRDS